MKIGFTKDAEKSRVKEDQEKRKTKWELYEGSSIVAAVRKARDLGWADKKVQVRWIETSEGRMYYVEPFEKDCGCRGMLKYDDFFN